jgi:hypothetical protein
MFVMRARTVHENTPTRKLLRYAPSKALQKAHKVGGMVVVGYEVAVLFTPL